MAKQSARLGEARATKAPRCRTDDFSEHMCAIAPRLLLEPLAAKTAAGAQQAP
jgi:hypothetical protein